MLLNPKLVSKPLGQFVCISVRQDPKIRIHSAFKCSLAYHATLVGRGAFRHFSKHSLFRACPQGQVIWENYISKKVRALTILSYRNFLRMQFKFQSLCEEILYRRQQLLQVCFVARNHHKIIGVASVPFYPQRVFYKVIKLAHIDIREHLRSEVANGNSFILSSRIALHDFPQKLKRVIVPNSSLKNAEQNGVINRVEKLSHVTLQCPTFLRPILTLCSKHIPYTLDALMRAFADTARKRGRNESLLKNRINYSKNCVMQHPVAHRRLVYPAALRVMNPKSVIWPVLVGFVVQVAAQLKNMLLDFLLKLGNVRLIPLVTLEHFPCRKEVLCGNYQPV